MVPSNLLGIAADLRNRKLFIDTSDADIHDRSKADAFTKAFALCQSGWIVVQTIGRAAQGLDITQLELLTVAFVFCALFTYLFWWHKPFDVESKHVTMCHASQALGTGEKYPEWYFLEYCQTLEPIIPDEDDSRVSDFNGNSNNGLIWLLMFTVDTAGLAQTVALYLIGAAFSAIHLGAWNWQFPSPIIQHLWRIFGTISVGSALACVPLVFVRRLDGRKLLGKRYEDLFDMVVAGLFMLLYIVYAVSRLVLIVLTFYCFTSMPAGVYEDVDWARFLPHFS